MMWPVYTLFGLANVGWVSLLTLAVYLHYFTNHPKDTGGLLWGAFFCFVTSAVCASIMYEKKQQE